MEEPRIELEAFLGRRDVLPRSDEDHRTRSTIAAPQVRRVGHRMFNWKIFRTADPFGTIASS